MQRRDPLDWFVHEKVAADLDEKPARYQIPRALDPNSPDPGERALVGILAVAGSVSTRVTPFLSRMVGQSILNRATEPLIGPPLKGVASFADAQDLMNHYMDSQGAISQKHRVLGLFDIDQKHPSYHQLAASNPHTVAAIERQYNQLGEIGKVVDTYIDKHDLTRKGVKINLQNGPLSGVGGGGSYMPSTKEVYLPRLGVENSLHELGHAADYTTPVGKVRARLDPLLSKGVMTALPIALAAGDHIKEMIPGSIDDKTIEFMQQHAPGIMAATLAATSLYPEAKASISAIRHIRELERAGKQPAGAAMLAAKRLGPLLGRYLLSAIPPVVGMALAKRYMNQARDEKRERRELALRGIEELEKSANILSPFKPMFMPLVDVGKQIGQSAADIIRQPHTLRRIGQAAKEVGTSPEFIHGALSAAIPGALGALYMYGTPGGIETRSRLHPETRDRLLKHRTVNIGAAAHVDERWRDEHPLRFTGLVAAGAALSGGIISRLVHDLTRVL